MFSNKSFVLQYILIAKLLNPTDLFSVLILSQACVQDACSILVQWDGIHLRLFVSILTFILSKWSTHLIKFKPGTTYYSQSFQGNLEYSY